MNDLVNASKRLTHKKQFGKDLQNLLNKFFKAKQDQLKQFFKTDCKSNNRTKISLIVQDCDTSSSFSSNKLCIFPANLDKQILLNDFYRCFLEMLSVRNNPCLRESGYDWVIAREKELIKFERKIILDSNLFPDNFVLSTILECLLYNSYSKEVEQAKIRSNFKLIKFFKYQRQKQFAKNVSNSLTVTRFVNKGVNLMVKNSWANRHLLVYILAEGNNSRIVVQLVNSGFELDVLKYNQTILIVLDNDIVYSNAKFFKTNFFNLQVETLLQYQVLLHVLTLLHRDKRNSHIISLEFVLELCFR